MALSRTAESRTRREVLQALGMLAASGAISSLGSARLFGQAGHVPAGIRFGVQLNAFPIDPKRFETFEATLEQVKQIGYQGFEAGFRFLSEQFAAPEMARRSIEQTGLTFFGIHIFLPTFGMYDPRYENRGAVDLRACGARWCGAGRKTSDPERRAGGKCAIN